MVEFLVLAGICAGLLIVVEVGKCRLVAIVIRTRPIYQLISSYCRYVLNLNLWKVFVTKSFVNRFVQSRKECRCFDLSFILFGGGVHRFRGHLQICRYWHVCWLISNSCREEMLNIHI